MTRYSTLKDPVIRDVLQAKLYSISRPFLLQLYRTLGVALNQDTVNVVLQFLFGNTKRVLETREQDWLELSGDNIVSEADFDAFLQYELH